jgi:hypothetical protein
MASAQADGSGDLYADLFVALRDVDGVPILSDTFYEGETPEEVTCIQPISYSEIPGIAAVENPVDGRDVYPVPLVGEGSTPSEPVEEACDPQPAYLDYVSEVELERLNLARTSDEVLWKKLVEVRARLEAAGAITLDGAGRITTDGLPIDASPEHAAMYGTTAADPVDPDRPGGLLDTGTIPGLGVSPAQISQGGDGFDEWRLAAAAVGTAGGKSVPVTVDTIQYYNRISAPDGGVGAWDYAPVLPKTALDEQFVDYTGFSYTRADVFTGCTTWLDVPTLTWKYGFITDRVEFVDIVDFAVQPAPGTVANVAGFAQMADDVRSVISYLHENEVVVDPDTGEGFFIDPVFENSCNAQADKVVELNQPSDAVPPSVTITDAPADPTTATDATFMFDAVDAASVLCVLDGGAVERCLSPKTYTSLEPGKHTFNVIAMGVAGDFASATHTWEILDEPLYVPLTPVRLADTRPGFVAADGRFTGTGAVTGGSMLEIPIAGRGGIPLDAEAAVLNLTVTGAAGNGYATAFPCGTKPLSSSINFQPGESIANELVAKLSPTGTTCVYVHKTAHVIIDTAGYM